MRFALVGPAPPYRGGISQYNSSLGAVLAEDHEVLLVSFSRQYPSLLFPGQTQREARGNGSGPDAEHVLDSINPVSWKRTAERIGAFRPDAVIFQWWHPFFGLAYSGIASRLKRLCPVPALFLCHNVYPHESLPLVGQIVEKWLIQKALGKADGFLVHSRRLGEEVRRFNQEASVRRIFHPRYDFYLQWDVDDKPDPGPARLLFFGTVRQYKGLDVFLKALAKIGSRLNFQATIAGEFYFNPQSCMRMAEKSGISERITWMNRYIENEDVPRLFREADVVVLPYRKATQSGVAPLAFQFEVPVIASDVGGLSEVVIDGQTGFLTPPGDASALAEAILAYFEQGKKAQFQENIRSFQPDLSWKQVVDNILWFLAPDKPTETP